MEPEVFSWMLFFAAMNRQPRARWDDWLSAWRFGEEGASLRIELAEALRAYERENPTVGATPSSQSRH